MGGTTEMAPSLNNERISLGKTRADSLWAWELITPENPGGAAENCVLYPVSIAWTTQGDAAIASHRSTLQLKLVLQKSRFF